MAAHQGVENERDGESLRLVRRTMAMLEALATRPDGATPKELSQALGLHLSTCYRLLNALVAAGYVIRREGGGLFRIGSRVAFLHHGYLATISPPADALPFLHALQLATGETAMLGQLEGDEVVVVASVEGTRPEAHPPGYVGLGVPAHRLAMGMSLLAWLPAARREAYLMRNAPGSGASFPVANGGALQLEMEQIRGSGYAIDRGQGIHPGVCCVAAPVGDDSKRVAAAIAVVGPCARFLSEEPALVAAVLAVSRAIGTMRPGRGEEYGRATAEPATALPAMRAAIEAAHAAVEAALSRVS